MNALKQSTRARLAATFAAMRFVGSDVLREHPAAVSTIRGRTVLYLRRRRDAADIERSAKWALGEAAPSSGRKRQKNGVSGSKGRSRRAVAAAPGGRS